MESRGVTSPSPAPRVHHPVPAPSVAAPRKLKASQYRVRRGDTLYSIAWRANRDYRSLARWNGIRPPYVIYPGQLIRLRPPDTSHSKTSPPVTRARSAAPAVSQPKTTARSSQSTTTRAGVAARPARQVTEKLRWRWPANGRLVATWKAGDPLRKGIKIAGREGQPVLAAEGGKVVYSGSGLIGYGRLIIIKHNDNYLSAYGHNRKLLVRQDQRVTKGQKIAEMGRANDGRPLLHFEIRRDGKPVDPLKLLPHR